MASESFGRLISLRSGLPLHPDNPEVVNDLGGREGVERLLGSLDDLLAHCADAFAPIGGLFSAFGKLKSRTEEIYVSYCEASTQGGTVLPCSSQLMRNLKVSVFLCPFFSATVAHCIILCLKASRRKITHLGSECVRQWSRFSETCLSLSTSPSKCLNSLLEANSEFLPVGISCDLPRIFTDFHTRIGEIVSRLDQRIPQACVAITQGIIGQQEELEAAVVDFLHCCQEINSQTRVDSTLLSGLFSVAEAISTEVKASGDLIASASSTAVTPDPASFEGRVNSLILKILVCFQDFKQLDEVVEVERGLIDQLIGCVSALPATCIVKLEGLIAALEKLSPTCTEDIVYLQGLTPLLVSLLSGVGARLRHLLHLLISWLSLGEFLAQVTFRLLNEGFCKPAALSKAAAAAGASGKEASSTCDDAGAGGADNENDEGGCTSLNAEGVDASGAKDVSKELQSQEQIEGTSDQRNEAQNQSLPDANDEGIEMSDDFEGLFDDGSGREEKDPKKDGDEGEEDELQGIDEEMGEAGDEPDELNQEMWASDGEGDDEEGEGEDGENEEKERKNAELDEAGVEDRGDHKSKGSKSTAVNEKTTSDEGKSGLDADDEEDTEGEPDDDDNDTTKTTAGNASAPAKASGSKTVAGDEKGNEKEEDEANAMEEKKRDEQRLAQQAAEMLEAEEEEAAEGEGKEEDMMDEFSENLELQPNPDEFENMDGEMQ